MTLKPRFLRTASRRTVVNLGLCALTCVAAQSADAAIELIAIGSLSGSSAGAYTDLSGLSGTLENGVSASLLGGVGSGLAWAGGNTFLAIPDRGPNATSYPGGALVDNTTSYIDRFHTVTLSLTAAPSSPTLPYTLTPTLTSTTLFYSTTPLTYGATAGLPNATPALNANGNFYFTGRSDGFNAGVQNSTNPNNARLDPEGIRVSADGKSLFVTDEYGPYVYQFDRATGARLRTFDLPDHFAVANQNSIGSNEQANPSGRVFNKGMEGLAITPDGKTLVGFMQSPLLQDGGDGGRMNRIVTIDIATGATHEYAYDNHLDSTNKNYNSSEILAINDHEFLVLERDGKGLGDGSPAVVKKVFKVDLSGATDVGGLQGEAALLANAVTKTEFLDLRTALNAEGITDANIPAKLEGLAFGQDLADGRHTLYLTNDNDFVQGIAGPNNFYVFAFDDTDLPNLELQQIAPVPLPATLPLLASALAGLAALRRRRRSASELQI